MTSIFEQHTSDEIFKAVEREVEFFFFWNADRKVRLSANRDGELIGEIFADLGVDVQDASDIDVLFIREMIQNEVNQKFDQLLEAGRA